MRESSKHTIILPKNGPNIRSHDLHANVCPPFRRLLEFPTLCVFIHKIGRWGRSAVIYIWYSPHTIAANQTPPLRVQSTPSPFKFCKRKHQVLESPTNAVSGQVGHLGRGSSIVQHQMMSILCILCIRIFYSMT